MNDEIKEILDKLKDKDWYDELDLTGTKWIELKWEETSQIVDYITNLQEEVEQYENPDDLTLFYMWLDEKAKDKMKHLQQENETLHENNQNMQEEMARVWEENDVLKKKLDRRYYKNEYERIKEENERLKHQLKVQEDLTVKNRMRKHIYKSRCEKAIEYIKEMLYPIGSCVNGSDLPYESIESLLNILQNGDDSQ